MTESALPSGDTGVLPSVFQYLDYRSFLKDRMLALNAWDSKYSQRWIARRAGISSPQLLSMIASGQRSLARDKAVPVAQALKLDAREGEYFGLIRDLGEAVSHDEQTALLVRIRIAFQNGLFSYMGDEAASALSQWYIAAIRELTLVQGFQNSPAWIAARLGISADDARSGMDFLLKLGFLRQSGERLERTEPSVHNFGRLPPMTVASYHMQILELAFRSLSRGKNHKYVETLTVAIPREALPELKESIKRFVRTIDLQLENETRPRTDVWQLAISFFSLTPSDGKAEAL